MSNLQRAMFIKAMDQKQSFGTNTVIERNPARTVPVTDRRQRQKVSEQIQWLTDCARSLGYRTMDELLSNDPARFNSLAGCWRNYHRRLYLQ